LQFCLLGIARGQDLALQRFQFLINAKRSPFICHLTGSVQRDFFVVRDLRRACDEETEKNALTPEPFRFPMEKWNLMNIKVQSKAFGSGERMRIAWRPQ
jgi:hypothetical protein